MTMNEFKSMPTDQQMETLKHLLKQAYDLGTELADLAEETGLSKTTVVRVANGVPVRPDTRYKLFGHLTRQ